MTKIVWDASGSRIYETGIERGVLYLSDDSGVAWNGLLGVTEDRSDGTSNPYYLDGVKYMDTAQGADFSGTLAALTYPDEFLPYDGILDSGGGLYLDGQVRGTFGLSYRTSVGDDVSGTALGYKTHLFYNLTAIPTDKAFGSIDNSADPLQLSWKITGVPDPTPGFRPTVHAMFDSRKVNATVLSNVNNILYGTSSLAPRLPSLVEMISLI